MKISLQLEADSAEELRAFFATFQTHTIPALIAGGVEVAGEWDVAQEPQPTKPAPVITPVITPIITQAPKEPEVSAEAPVKAKRGRPPKVQPEAPAAVAEVSLPATAPVQQAAAPSGNGTDAGVSRQDLLDVFAEYVQRYGANFGYTDISGLLQKHLGEGVRKASDVPETMLGQAISAIKAAILENPFNRKRDYA